MHATTIIGLAILIVLLGAGWGTFRVHRKGDFAFRIKRLQKRTAILVSKIMEFESESDYFALYENGQDKKTIQFVESAMEEVNELAVGVSDHLKTLLRRANSPFDFTDLYVDIGIQEEKLEKAEATYQEASVKLKTLPKL